MTLTDEQRIEELEAEVAYWKGEAQHNIRSDAAARIQCALNLTGAEAWVVAQLHAAGGAVVRHERLEEDMPGCNWEGRADDSNVVQVIVCRIRRKLDDPGCIETVRCHGYRIGDALRATVDAVLA